MAQDELEKSVQGIKDPGERKKAYYSAQRQQAEKGAASGDRAAAKTAGRIAAKTGNGAKNDYYTTEALAGKGVADFSKGLGDLEKKAIPFAAPEARGASIARGLIPKASEAVGSGLAELGAKASQWLGKAKPVASKLMGGVEKKAASGGAKALKGAEQKALSGGKASEAKALSGPKGAGRAKSSPMKRETPNSMRYNPQSGKMVGKSPMRIQSDAIERRGRKAAMEETADMNKAAAKQAPKAAKESVTSKIKNKAARSSLGAKTPTMQGAGAAAVGAGTSKAKNKSAKSKARST